MVDCDYCGREFGNAGALANHKNSCPERPKTSGGEFEESAAEPEPEPKAVKAPEETKQAQPPAPAEAQQGQGQNNAIQTNEQAGNHVETGMQAADALADVGIGGPDQKAKATEKATQFAAGLLARVGQKKAEQMRETHQNAKNNAGREIEASNEYPTCAECQGQIAHVPNSGTFRCPHCEALLEA